jgi:hypothetical protein
MGFTYGGSKPVRSFRNSNQMRMIGHQAVAPDFHIEMVAPLDHEINIGLTIFI